MGKINFSIFLYFFFPYSFNFSIFNKIQTEFQTTHHLNLKSFYLTSNFEHMFHFYCRIRPPTQFEQLTSTHVPRSDLSRSRSPMKSPKPIKSPSNLNLHMYSIFSCPDEKSPEIAICSENPIKGTLISKNFGKERDLQDFKASVLEKAKFFYFDRVFPTSSSQNQIYTETLKEKITNLLRGVNATVILYGPNS